MGRITNRTSKLKLPQSLVDSLEEIRCEVADDGFTSARALFRFQADMSWIEKEYPKYMPMISPFLERLKSAGHMMTNAQEMRRAACVEFVKLEEAFETLSDDAFVTNDEM